MKSAVAIIGALCCGASSAGAFVVPSWSSSSSRSSVVASSASRRTTTTSVRRNTGLSMMSSVATPPAPSSAAATPERKSKVQSIGSNDDYATAMAKHDDKLVVIKFYDQFCRACDEIRPRFEDLSRSLPEEDAVFYELEFSGAKDLCKQLGIRRLPTVQIYDGAAGRVADLPAGPSRFSDVEDRFAEVVSSKSSGGNPAAGIMAE